MYVADSCLADIVLYKYIWKNKDQFIIYFWQGRNSTINDKGTSALLTIELDDKTGRNAKEVRTQTHSYTLHNTARTLRPQRIHRA